MRFQKYRSRRSDAVNAIKDETSYICIPAVTILKNGENEDFALDGCALFDKDESFTMYLSSGDAQGLAYLNDEIKKGFVSAELQNGKRATFVINKGKTSYKIVKENGALHYKLTVNVSCDLEEVEGAEYFSTEYRFMEDMKTAVGKTIAEKMENTLIVLKSKHGGDAVHYGKRLKLKDYEEYKLLQPQWDETFREVKTSINVNVTIRRIGEESFHSKK